MQGLKISLGKAEAAYVFRVLETSGPSHRRSPQFHAALMAKLSNYLEVSYRGDKVSHVQPPLFPAPEAGVD